MKIKTKNKRACLPSKKAFSLIELLVVIAIISIATGAVFINQRKSVQPKSDVDTAVRKFMALVRQQQNNAINGQQVEIGGTMKTICGFGVKWDQNTITQFYIRDNDKSDTMDVCPASGSNTDNNVSINSIGIEKAHVQVLTSDGWVFFKLPFAPMSASTALPERIVFKSTINPDVTHTVCLYGNSMKDKPETFNDCKDF